MRSTEVSPNPYGELGPVFEKGDVSVKEEKMNYPSYGFGNKPYFTPSSGWMPNTSKTYIYKMKAMKVQGETLGECFYNFEMGTAFQIKA